MSTPNKVMVIDLETTTYEWYGSRASPRHPKSYVVMHGQAIDEQPFDGIITGSRYEGRADWLQIPDDVWLLVCHNSPFEMNWMLVQQREAIMKFLKRGGRVFDTAYAHYLLSNQQDTYPALNDIAPLYGGTPKVDGIKALWDQGVNTEDIDPDLLSEYLLGPSGDIDNTRRVFWGQVTQLQQRGMWDMALDRMEGQLFNCFAMDAGLCIDRDFAYAELARMNTELDAILTSLRELRSHFPEGVVFKESSDYHMSAWLYGGPIKYRARVLALDAEGNKQYLKVDCHKFGEQFVPTEALATHPDPAKAFEACVLNYGAVDRYASGKNKGQPKVHKVQGTEPKTKWGEEIYQCPALVDLDLLPASIKDEFVKSYSGKRKLADDTPVLSTGSEPLLMLSKRKELPEAVRTVLVSLLKFARLDKDIGTYFLREEKDDDGNVVKQSGMLQYLTPEGLVHHVLNTTSTATGRLSSQKPNAQNLPRGDEDEGHTSKVKHMMVSRFGSDGYIIEADYSALEVVTLAALTQDKALVQALLDGTDMHCMRLSKQLNEPYESVLEKCHNKDHPEHKQYKQMRTDVKPKSFAFQYGATARGIAFATGCTVEDAEAFIAAETALFPDVEAWYNTQVIPAVERSVTQHREMTDDGGWHMYGVGTWQSPAGTTYSFREYPKTRWVDGQKITGMEFKPTQIKNYPCQGEAGFFVQGVCGLVIRWLIANDFFGGKAFVTNTVHDAIYMDIHKDVLDQVCGPLKAIMEFLPQYFAQKYGYTMGVPFPVEVEYGKSWAEKQTWKPA